MTQRPSSNMVVIKAVAFANGEHCPHAGQYVETFDHEAYDGRGYGTFTPDLDKAMKFENSGHAFQFWTKVPRCKPRRPDGKPNKPLTALTVEILREQDEREAT